MSSITDSMQPFTMDPNLLVSVLRSQAGSLSKALLEGVMNSIDAGASRVDIELRPDGFFISDNGRGFCSDDEIRDWFGRFGTPHAEGDATYGVFRMGRGQLMSFASTVWRSNSYCMEVDIERRGMGYQLSRLETPVKGCHIEGMLYRPLTAYQLTDVLTELREFVAYTPKPVFVNGELFGAPASRLKSWTFEDEDAFYRLNQEDEELQVYNLGVFVVRVPNWKVGMGGTIVSKRALRVNFARNAILENECTAWQRICAKLEELVVAKLQSCRKLSEGERKYVARRLGMLSRLGLDPLRTKVLTDPSGRHLALSDLRSFKRFVQVEENEALACAVHGADGTFVVTSRLLARFGAGDLRHFLELVRAVPGALADDIEILDAQQLSQLGLGGSKILDSHGLRPREQAAFETLSWLNTQLGSRLADAGHTNRERKLLPGTHKRGTFVAWTDGATYITANRKHLKLFERGLDGVHEWLLTLLHEYMHDTDDSESHSHGEVFYRKFHDVAFACAGDIGRLTQSGLAYYLNALNRHGIARPQVLTRQLRPASLPPQPTPTS